MIGTLNNKVKNDIMTTDANADRALDFPRPIGRATRHRLPRKRRRHRRSRSPY